MNTQPIAEALRDVLAHYEHRPVPGHRAGQFLARHGRNLLAALSEHGGGGEAVGHVTTVDGKVNVNWYHGPLPDGAELFAARPPASQSAEPRFFIEHGVVHDRQTGKHIGAAFEDDASERLLALLQSLENDRDAWRMTAKSFNAATPPPQPRGEGMVLVPREPTEAMLAEGRQVSQFESRKVGNIYRSMLAAAPGEGGGE